MAKIYLSSTYKDLAGHRKAVYEQLRRMKHTVTAMEDYVAKDERPADLCTRDVAASDLYVGIFAWRYGYIPPAENPERLSVTELEYRAAGNHKIPRLIFLLDEAAAWPPQRVDFFTGEGDTGVRIRTFRKQVEDEHTVSLFTSEEDLAAKAGAAVHLSGALAEATDVSFNLADIVSQDEIDNPAALFNQSRLPYLIQQIAGLGDSPLLKIDLRDGRYWWSTRLYALATLADEYTAVDWLLFLDCGTDYVGMIRPGDLRRALAAFQPELEECYRVAAANLPPRFPGMTESARAAQVLEAFVGGFSAWPGGEEGLRFLVDSTWVTQARGISTVKVERSGPFDPLATHQLLDAVTPFVPVTKGSQLIKVIDRVGVATAIARTVVERRLGRA